MKLLDLDPRWIGAKDYSGSVGLSFECPCCLNTDKATRLAVYYVSDVVGDHGEAIHLSDKAWTRTGFTFFDMTLSPSIDASEHGHWHGHITNGEIK